VLAPVGGGKSAKTKRRKWACLLKEEAIASSRSGAQRGTSPLRRLERNNCERAHSGEKGLLLPKKKRFDEIGRGDGNLAENRSPQQRKRGESGRTPRPIAHLRTQHGGKPE